MSVLLLSLLAASPITLQNVREASRQNTEVLRAELTRRQADERIVSSRGNVLPHVSLDSGASGSASGPQRHYTTVPDPSSPGEFQQAAVDVPSSSRSNFNLQLQISQLLYDGGRWWNQIEQAGDQQQAAAGRAEEQVLASELEGVRRFYELYRAQKTKEVLLAMAQRSQTQLDRARALFEAGRAGKRDAIDAEVNLGNDTIATLRQEQRITSAQVDLSVWIGRSGAEELFAGEPGELSAGPSPVPTLDGALSAARKNRPLLRSVAKELSAASKAVEIAAGSLYPRLSVYAGYSRASPSAEPFFLDPGKQNSVSGGLSFQWDLFSGFSTVSQVRSARYERDSVELSAARTAREIDGEVRRSLSALSSQLLIFEVAKKNRELATQGLRLAEERFSAGAGSTLEVRDAQLKLTQSELSLLESRIDVEIARAAVHRVTGGMEGVAQ